MPCVQGGLSDPTLRPPYRAIGYSYTLSHLHFLGIAGYRAIPPFWGYRKIMLGGGLGGRLGGGIAGQCCPLCYRALLGCVEPLLSQIAVSGSLGGGGEGVFLRETGTICQIVVSTWKRCTFWGLKGPFSGIWHY